MYLKLFQYRSNWCLLNSGTNRQTLLWKLLIKYFPILNPLPDSLILHLADPPFAVRNAYRRVWGTCAINFTVFLRSPLVIGNRWLFCDASFWKLPLLHGNTFPKEWSDVRWLCFWFEWQGPMLFYGKSK